MSGFCEILLESLQICTPPDVPSEHNEMIVYCSIQVVETIKKIKRDTVNQNREFIGNTCGRHLGSHPFIQVARHMHLIGAWKRLSALGRQRCRPAYLSEVPKDFYRRSPSSITNAVLVQLNTGMISERSTTMQSGTARLPLQPCCVSLRCLNAYHIATHGDPCKPW